MASYPHVALIVATAKQYDRGLLRGIGRYIKGHGPWSVYIEERGAGGRDPFVDHLLEGRRHHRPHQGFADG